MVSSLSWVSIEWRREILAAFLWPRLLRSLLKGTTQYDGLTSSLLLELFRVVIWSLRAKQAKTPSEDFNRNLLIYWQITFSVGYMSIHGKLVSLLRCLVVKTTKGIVLPAEQSDSPGGENLGDKPQVTDVVSPAISLEQEDQPKKRALYRRMFGLLALQSIVPFVIGTVGGNGYPDAVISAGAASIIQILRSVVCTHSTADVLMFVVDT